MLLILQTSIILAAIHGLFLAIAVYVRYKKHISNIFLSFWLAGTVYLLTISWFLLSNRISHQTFFRIIEFDLFLIGPFFYLYVKHITNINFKLSKFHVMHFIYPVLSFFILLVYLLTDNSFFNFYYNFGFLTFISGTIYSFTSIWLLFKKRDDFYNWMITVQRKIWIISIVFITTITWILSVIIIIIVYLYSELESLKTLMHGIIALLLACEIYLIGYFGLTHPIIFVDELIYKNKKSENNYLENENTDLEYASLKAFINDTKIFTDIDLTLDELSFQSKTVPPTRLSQIIYKHERIHFNEFLNSYRINEIKKYFTDCEQKNKSILELAFEAGFNSKATFNRVFKEKTGFTPSEYRKNIQK